MSKIIFISGSTDGIGLETAKNLVSLGHHVLLHGRNAQKLSDVEQALAALSGDGRLETYRADLSSLVEVDDLADEVLARHPHLDVIINNAGVYTSSQPITADGLDVRFAVNTIAPYRLTQRLLPFIREGGRVINLSSAAQSTVELSALAGERRLTDSAAYAQSKLALTMWSRSLGLARGGDGPVVVAVNPGSLLGTKMVREAFGRVLADVSVGAEILVRAALSPEFADSGGQYFDNDQGRFAPPHPDALDPLLCQKVVEQIEAILQETTR
ncbi:MAG: SDR family NAD(P)-dependent oxidoreductase [Gemmatimonadetes bacterium]|nr:SDR family NAD(P)-dependent oxidoreductase [Gemmatimonadota bacterium]